MRRALAAGLIAVTVGTGCTAEPADPPDEPSGSLTVYSGRKQDLMGDLFAQFEKETGIKLKVKYGDTAELAAQLLEEGDKSPADVFLAQDAGALGAIQAAGLFSKLHSDIISIVDKRYRSREDKWIGTSGRARVLVYNPDAIRAADLPAKITDLIDPKWKDKIGWAPTNGSFQSFVTAMTVLKGKEATRSWLSAMKANGAKTYANNDAITLAVSAGELQAGLVNHYYPFEMRVEDPGLKAKNHFFKAGDPGGLINVAGVGLLASSKRKATAERFVEYLLSEPGQNYFSSQTFEYPLRDGVEASPEIPALSSLEPPDIDLSDLEGLKAPLELLKEVGLL